jgi:hypothetical protein
VQELAEPDDKVKRCDLLLSLGDALLAAGEPEHVLTRVAPDASALADAVGDRSRAFRACHLALESLEAQGAATSTRRPEYLQWAERARGYANSDGIDRVRADLALAGAWQSRGRRQEARVLQLEALALSRRLGDPETLIRFDQLDQLRDQAWQAARAEADQLAMRAGTRLDRVTSVEEPMIENPTTIQPDRATAYSGSPGEIPPSVQSGEIEVRTRLHVVWSTQ